MSEAAEVAGIGKTLLWQWRQDDPEFARDYEEAFHIGTDVYELEAKRRAFDGNSDILLIFLMKARDPHRFNRRMIGIGADENAPPVQANATVMIYPKKESGT